MSLYFYTSIVLLKSSSSKSSKQPWARLSLKINFEYGTYCFSVSKNRLTVWSYKCKSFSLLRSGLVLWWLEGMRGWLHMLDNGNIIFIFFGLMFIMLNALSNHFLVKAVKDLLYEKN